MRDASTAISKKLAEAIPAIGLRYEKDSLVVGVPDTFSVGEIDAALDKLVKELDTTVEAQQIEESVIREFIEVSYEGLAPNHFIAPSNLNSRSEGPIIDLVNRVLEAAVKMRASDIHIEPLENELLIRIRIDGKLENLTTLQVSFAPAIVSRLKVLAKISIVERRRPQDGQFTTEVAGRTIDVRLSTVATLFGEKAALRLLDTRRNLGNLTTLGMAEDKLNNFSRILKARHGLLIASGPTGSGKTTTMHSALQIVNSPDLNVCTIEDPVEYVVPGINHIPVNEQAGLSFATQLRALLRQDPDIVLVGEIRDAETARIAVQAALAGRLVLSTLHAPDALGAIYRLFQMGIEPYQVAASLVGVVSQRLVRKNCPYCVSHSSVSNLVRSLVQEKAESKKLNLLSGLGCTICRNTGYLDRIGAFQLLEVDEQMRELISQRPSPNQLEAMARKRGLISLQEEAMHLAADGHTSVFEVMEMDAEADE